MWADNPGMDGRLLCLAIEVQQEGKKLGLYTVYHPVSGLDRDHVVRKIYRDLGI
jgi:hypothetical protein